jgi:hypothetical protein
MRDGETRILVTSLKHPCLVDVIDCKALVSDL